MLVPPLSLATDDFVVEHLDDSLENLQLIQDFACSNNAKGLELYLKQQALNDEAIGQSRTYLVKDALTRDLACYFSLRTCLIPYALAGRRINLSAIELANFAVNDNYRRSQRAVSKIGEYVFVEIIRPLAKHISTCVGAGWLCIFALPKEKVSGFGFRVRLAVQRLSGGVDCLIGRLFDCAIHRLIGACAGCLLRSCRGLVGQRTEDKGQPLASSALRATQATVNFEL